MDLISTYFVSVSQINIVLKRITLFNLILNYLEKIYGYANLSTNNINRTQITALIDEVLLQAEIMLQTSNKTSATNCVQDLHFNARQSFYHKPSS